MKISIFHEKKNDNEKRNNNENDKKNFKKKNYKKKNHKKKNYIKKIKKKIRYSYEIVQFIVNIYFTSGIEIVVNV